MKKTLITAAMAFGLACTAAAEAPALATAIIQEATFDSDTLFYKSDSSYSGLNATLMLVIDLDLLNDITVSSTFTHLLGTQPQTVESSLSSTTHGHSGIGLKKEGDSYVACTWWSSSARTQSLTLGSTSDTNKVVLTLAIGDNDTTNPSTLYVYNGGAMTSVNDDGLRSTVTLNSVHFKDSDLAGAVTSLYMFDSRLSDGDIESLSATLTSAAAIPEPATATLSLLALAGLAARRRRK